MPVRHGRASGLKNGQGAGGGAGAPGGGGGGVPGAGGGGRAGVCPVAMSETWSPCRVATDESFCPVMPDCASREMVFPWVSAMAETSCPKFDPVRLMWVIPMFAAPCACGWTAG